MLLLNTLYKGTTDRRTKPLDNSSCYCSISLGEYSIQPTSLVKRRLKLGQEPKTSVTPSALHIIALECFLDQDEVVCGVILGVS